MQTDAHPLARPRPTTALVSESGRVSRDPNAALPEERFQYDDAGSRLTDNGIVSTYDAQQRQKTYGATVTYTHDANGHRETRTDATGTTTYGFDGMGGLHTVSLPDGTQLEYVLDGLQRRVAKKRNGVVERRWLYNGQYRVVGEYDGAGVFTRYVYGTFGHSPDYMVRAGVSYRFVHDHLGSIRLVVNAATGAVAQRLDYDAWGAVLRDTAPGFQLFGYAGGPVDVDSRLSHFGLREYDPETGGFLSPEPLLRAPHFLRSNSQGAPPYAYAQNSPLEYIDPEGRSPKSLKRLVSMFRFYVEFMTRHGMREKNTFLNNLHATSPYYDNLGCEAQSSLMMSWLAKDGYEDFTFEMAGGRTSKYDYGPHQWIVAASTKDNVVIILDPWGDTIRQSVCHADSAEYDYPGNYPMKAGGPWGDP